MNSCVYRLRRAFTLIELLVVIAIIAILAAILFPVFAQAKASAKQTTCLSNMKQLGTSFALYLNDFDGSYPGTLGNRYPNAGWVLDGQGPEVGTTNPPCAKTDYNHSDLCSIADPTRGSLYPYVKNEQVYKCPETRSAPYVSNSSITLDSSTERVTFAMNEWFKLQNVFLRDGGYGSIGMNESGVSFPSDTFLLIDEDVTSHNDGNFWPGGDTFGKQHRSGANLCNSDTSAKRFSFSAIYSEAIFRRFTPTRNEE